MRISTYVAATAICSAVRHLPPPKPSAHRAIAWESGTV